MTDVGEACASIFIKCVSVTLLHNKLLSFFSLLINETMSRDKILG